MSTSQDIINYWFQGTSDDAPIPQERTQFWFRKSPATDQEIRDKFEPLITAAKAEELNHWKTTPQGRLALIILLDQFTRNVYRDTPAAFSGDTLALNLALEGLDQGDDQRIPYVQRPFFYLPLEHAEDLGLQDRCVSLMEQLKDNAPEVHKGVMEANHQYAIQHQLIIQRFGRFPHRNKILSRVSTEEEQLFLTQPGSSF